MAAVGRLSRGTSGAYDRPVSPIRRLLGTPPALRRVALASIVANVAIVITGGAVRLTGSGLGCPTWPRCTSDSYVATPEMGVHGLIEFGNRLLTFAVGLVAVLALVIALLQRPRRPGVLTAAALVFAGVPAQAVLGGFTVLTDLNPWVVAAHFLLSMAVIAVAYTFWRRAGGGSPGWPAPKPLRTLARLTTGVAVTVLVLGTVVTGSGPHAGDANARRTGLDPAAVAQLHADAVFLLLGMSVAVWYAVRATGAPPAATRAALVLVGVELAQGAVGFAQYFTNLPAVLVGIHLAGAAAVWLAMLGVLSALGATAPAGGRDRGGEPVGQTRRGADEHRGLGQLQLK
jgi:cytochrome c oxidase assembly protein subunit 15